MNWRTVVGIILILSSIEEMLRVFFDYRAGKSEASPYDVMLGFIIVAFIGFLLMRKGMQKSVNKLKK
ncbi:hypothetical protein FRZ67_20650 [Panacibacter ginsenosidivorans]|uniref:Uncharacterized protein n=1 Tax=Panacibacter ginsenosidivorans TaxID=1813871 RepID=A0A5B8VEU6_9BACT|nr:hypothetical protein [Panacibacter ginsenosidivorans]QEC69593.1 hypothetical protein FRZ67_20650 [Panacibacter ginsenosidivorans]